MFFIQKNHNSHGKNSIELTQSYQYTNELSFVLCLLSLMGEKQLIYTHKIIIIQDEMESTLFVDSDMFTYF